MPSNSVGRRCGAALALVVLAIGGLLAAPAAQAAEADGGATYVGTRQATTTVPDGAARGDRAAAAVPVPVLRCHLAVADPHNSHHVNGRINVVATLSCKGLNAASMTVSVVLAKTVCTPGCHTVNVGNVGTASVTYKPSVSASSSVSCSPGKYFGTAAGTLVAPPGVKPPTGHLEASSKTVSITC